MRSDLYNSVQEDFLFKMSHKVCYSLSDERGDYGDLLSMRR